MQLRVSLVFGFLAWAFVSFHSAFAHEVRPSIATLKFDSQGGYVLSISTNVEAILADIGSEHDDTDASPNAALYNKYRSESSEELTERFKAFAPSWIEQLGMSFGETAALPGLQNLQIPDVGDIEIARDSIINLQGTLPVGVENLEWAYPEKYGSSVLRIERPGQELFAKFLSVGEKSGPLPIGVSAPQPWAEAFWDYIVIGYTHILPKGLDHILFVLGLFLLAAKLRPLLWQVTAFTLAHSVTLGLGLYGIVEISPSIVEPLIALSIVYVAVENLFTAKLHVWRPVIVFGFGLLHGLGFAGILTEIGMPSSQFLMGLIAFNVGVELGQLTVIALAFLAVGWFASKPWYRSRITNPLSIGIAVIGFYWFVERVWL